MTISQNDVSCGRLPLTDTSNSGYKQPGSTSEGCASKNGTCLGLPTSESGSNSLSEAQFMEFVTQTHENRRFSVNHHTRVPQIQATSSLIVRLAPVMLKSMPSPARYRAAMVQTQFDWILILSETTIRLSGRWAPTRELEGTRLPVSSGKGPTENGTLNSAGAIPSN